MGVNLDNYGAGMALMRFLSHNRDGELRDVHVVGGHPFFTEWWELEANVLWCLRECAAKYGWPETVVRQLEVEMLPILKMVIRNNKQWKD
jgi:hypothetical protein